MIPRQAHAAVDRATPKLNPVLANGLAITHMKEAEHYIDAVFKSVASGFPPGFRYLGCRRCTPHEEFMETIKNKNNRRLFDVARSDVYLMEYSFQYQDDEPIKKYLYLPFVGVAGTIYLSGSRFVISPILADRVISVGLMTIFIRLLKAKLTFNRISHVYKIGPNDHQENVQVAWSKIHNNKQRPNRPAVTAECTLVHYLLCKYGFTNMFQKFLGIQPLVGGEEITHEEYPVKDWVICYASGHIPKGVKAGYRATYQKSNLRIAIKRADYTANARNLIAGFFYVVDHFPQRMLPEFVEDTRMWMVLLGHAIWAGSYSEGKLFMDVQDHISSLDEYVDSISMNKLRQIGYPCKDIYELFFLIISNFNDWLLASEDRVSTMYDKELAILQFVFYDVISNINQLYFKLNAAKKKELTSAKIKDLLNSCLRQGLIYGLTKNNGVVSTASTSGDNMALKITNALVPQSASNRVTASKARAVIGDPSKRLHASIAEVGGYINLPKSSPDGRSRLNLCLNINESGLVLRNPEFIPLIDGVQERIRR